MPPPQKCISGIYDLDLLTSDLEKFFSNSQSYARFYCNPSTKYRIRASREMGVNEKRTDGTPGGGLTMYQNTLCLLEA